MQTILVVDDNKTMLQLARQFLSGRYSVVPVLSGKMALYYLEKKKADLILLDLLMPEMDGFMALEKIRNLPNGKEVPIIFLSAETDKKMESRCLQAGACDFIVKPFDFDVMISRIEKALERR